MDPNQQNTPSQPEMPDTAPSTSTPTESSAAPVDFSSPVADSGATQSAEAEALGDVEVSAPTGEMSQPVAQPVAPVEAEKKSHMTMYLLIALGVVALVAGGVFAYITFLS